MAKRQPIGFWKRHVVAFEAGKETRAAYCRRHGLNYWTFESWRRRLRHDAARSQALVPVVVESGTPFGSALSVDVRVGSVAVSIPASVDAVWLGTLLRTVATC